MQVGQHKRLARCEVSLFQPQMFAPLLVDNGSAPAYGPLLFSHARMLLLLGVYPGISNVVAVDTSGDDAVTLMFVHSFYLNLAQGFTLRDSFDAGVHR